VKTFLERAKQFLGSEDGPTATEYGVLLALIALAVLVAMGAFGTKMTTIYLTLTGTLDVF
jgi:Flp pilus assembly pilin Flp